jgi:transcriptional regulator with XRE-family HTH domain
MILGRQLQALREKAGMSYEQAAAAIVSSPYTVRRMERAEGGLKPLTVRSLLMAYGITDPREIDTFLALARDASKPGWWHSYDDVLPSWFRTFVGLEEAATLIRGYDPHWIPGLLQTPQYARASVQTGFPDATAEEVERRVELRLARQHILARPDPPRLWLVLDENTLRRPAATTGPDVMRAHRGRRPAEHHRAGAAVHRRAAPRHVRAVPDLPVRRPRPARHRVRRDHDQRLLP